MIQSALTRLLQNFYFVSCIIYCDDIPIYTSSSKTGHLSTVHSVLSVLHDANAKMRLRKLQIARRRVTFLGMQVDSQGWIISNKF